MPTSERTRERSKFYAGIAVAAIGLVATIGGVVISAAQISAVESGATFAVASGTVEGVGLTSPAEFEAAEQTYAVRLLVPISGSADTEREARTLSCDVTDSTGTVTTISGANASVHTLINGAHEIGRVDLAAGTASVRCGWSDPTDADARRAIARDFDVIAAQPWFLESGAPIAFTGVVAFLAGALVIAIGWKRFRVTSRNPEAELQTSRR